MVKAVPPRARAGVPKEPVLIKIRVPLIQRARLATVAGEEDVFMMDIGLRGVFVERSSPLPVGDEVRIRFLLPGNEIPVAARCRVAWWHGPEQALRSRSLPAGMGLEFIEVDDRGDERVRGFVEDFLRRPGGRRFHRPPPNAEESE
jgi:Tfp pilus assembly protein PilZ